MTQKSFFEVVILSANHFEHWVLRHYVVLMLKYLQKRLFEIALYVLFGGLASLILLVEGLCAISFKVDFDGVHSIHAFLVPWCLFIEERPKLLL